MEVHWEWLLGPLCLSIIGEAGNLSQKKEIRKRFLFVEGPLPVECALVEHSLTYGILMREPGLQFFRARGQVFKGAHSPRHGDAHKALVLGALGGYPTGVCRQRAARSEVDSSWSTIDDTVRFK